MAIVQARHGSNRASARAVGVGESTWRRWLSGVTTPRPVSMARLASAARFVRWQNTAANFRTIIFDQGVGRGAVREGRRVSAQALDFNPAANAKIRAAFSITTDEGEEWEAAAEEWLKGVRDDGYKDLFDAYLDALDADYWIKITGIEI
jgi:hypothetical protein